MASGPVCRAKQAETHGCTDQQWAVKISLANSESRPHTAQGDVRKRLFICPLSGRSGHAGDITAKARF
jgi:hypothetical protein